MNPIGQRIAILAVAMVVAAGCAAAGAWQWNRHASRSAATSTQEANALSEPVPIERLVAPGEPLATHHTWRPVTVTGQYGAGATVLLRNRPVQGLPAVGVLEPFTITDGDLAGATLVVHRGWVPPSDGLAADEPVPSPAEGTVELVVRLRPSEPPSGSSVPGQVQRIAVDQVLAASGTEPAAVIEAYGVLVTEEGDAAPGLRTVPLPDTGFGPHLSYALQWWVFAVGALVGAVVLIRRDVERDAGPADGDADDDDAADRGPGAADRRSQPPRRPRRLSAEEEEDALVDAARRSGSPTSRA